MRRLRLTFGPGQALVMATVLTGGCGGETDNSVTRAAGGGSSMPTTGTTLPSGGAQATTMSTGGAQVASGGGSIIVIPSGGSGATGGGTQTAVGGSSAGVCSRPPEQLAWSDCETASGGAPSDYPYVLEPLGPLMDCRKEFVVPVAPEGTPPTTKELCASSESQISAGWAARITLTRFDSIGRTATGRITLAPDLVDSTVSAVVVSVIDRDSGLGSIAIGTVERKGNVFEFPISFASLDANSVSFPRLVLTAKLSLDCAGTVKEVISTTALYLCRTEVQASWISSGDVCGECAVICEMAASPIIPPVGSPLEPLSQAVRAQVTRIGQYGSAVLLQAQHDGGADRFSYEWDISAGRILWQEQDLLLWAPPPSAGEHLVQVSLLADDAAAVASARIRSMPLEAV